MSEPKQSLEEFLFEAALAKPAAAERAAFLDGVCRDNPALRQRLEVLLEGHFQAKGFLAAQPEKVKEVTSRTASESEAGSQVIGRYKLLERIGEGGFGEVWMAEQKEPVKRRVALKIIKLGMDTKQVVARFEAERQALAMMDHPNIAKVFDGGATDTGRPYFVMELVRGVRITEYCDQNHLSNQERLKLFMQVCRAIQHAHQKGIIHRDIKPSNILVTLEDGQPVPKVIDFGIAKATQQELTDKTVFTQFRLFLGTPAYVSPEQAEMTSQDIDTRSDIYSLGVLLYELLTGTTPFDTQELIKAGLEGMRQIICERPPPRPSTRVNRALPPAQEGGAAHSKIENQKSKIATDLDWIVMKCLEKDRARRYETANGLARDLERHLNHEPVVARPPSRLYEFQKTVRRHWVGFIAALAVVAALAMGLVVSGLQTARARRAEKLAQDRLAEAQTISRFLSEVFQSTDPNRNGRTVTVAESLGASEKRLEASLAGQPEVRAKLQAAIAWSYHTLGLNLEAIPLQEQVRDYFLRVHGLEYSNTIQAMFHLALYYDEVGRDKEALKLSERVLALRQKVNGPEDPDTLWAMSALARSYWRAGRGEDTLRLEQAVLDVRRRQNGPEDPATLTAMDNVASAYDQLGRGAEALKLREQVLGLRQKVSGAEHPDTLMAMNNVANSYYFAGRAQDALKLREQVLALRRKVSGPEHPDTLMAMINLSQSYDQVGRTQEALKLREELVPLRRKISGPEHPETLWAMNDLGISYYEAGRLEEALKLNQEVLELRRKVLGPEHPDTLNSVNQVAALMAAADDPKVRNGANAIQLMEPVVALTQRTNALYLDTLASAYAEAGQFEKAVRVVQEAIALLHTDEEKADPGTRLKLYQAHKPYRLQPNH